MSWSPGLINYPWVRISLVGRQFKVFWPYHRQLLEQVGCGPVCCWDANNVSLKSLINLWDQSTINSKYGSVLAQNNDHVFKKNARASVFIGNMYGWLSLHKPYQQVQKHISSELWEGLDPLSSTCSPKFEYSRHEVDQNLIRANNFRCEQSNKTWQGRYRLILLCALNVLNAELVSLPTFILLKRAGAWKNVWVLLAVKGTHINLVTLPNFCQAKK